MIDRGIIGREWPAYDVEVEKGRLRLLAKAIGEERGIYVDEGAARAAGYRSIVAPPTFAFCVLSDAPNGIAFLAEVGIPVEELLHGEQELEFIQPICAGDRVRVTRRVVDVYDKKGGALEFVVFESEVRMVPDGALMARGKQTMIRRRA